MRLLIKRVLYSRASYNSENTVIVFKSSFCIKPNQNASLFKLVSSAQRTPFPEISWSLFQSWKFDQGSDNIESRFVIHSDKAGYLGQGLCLEFQLMGSKPFYKRDANYLILVPVSIKICPISIKYPQK